MEIGGRETRTYQTANRLNEVVKCVDSAIFQAINWTDERHKSSNRRSIDAIETMLDRINEAIIKRVFTSNHHKSEH